MSRQVPLVVYKNGVRKVVGSSEMIGEKIISMTVTEPRFIETPDNPVSEFVLGFRSQPTVISLPAQELKAKIEENSEQQFEFYKTLLYGTAS